MNYPENITNEKSEILSNILCDDEYAIITLNKKSENKSPYSNIKQILEQLNAVHLFNITKPNDDELDDTYLTDIINNIANVVSPFVIKLNT